MSRTLRRVTRTALVAALLATLPGAVRAEPVQARWASEFLDSVGVNAHFGDTGSGYAARLTILLDRLREAHIRHIRDWAPHIAGQLRPDDNAAAFRTLAKAGIRVDFLVDPGVSARFVREFPARVAPAAELLELPNEINNGPNALPDWPATLRNWTVRFHELVEQAGLHLPIIGPSLVVLSLDNSFAQLGDISRYVSFGNVHDYSGGLNPGTSGWGGPGVPPCGATRYGSLAFAVCYAQAATPGRPVMSTETGWTTGAGQAQAVSEPIQARYVTRTLLLHFAAGIARTYIYQLLDSGTDDGRSMGILRSEGEPKPAFLALSSLMRALDDGSAQHGTAGSADLELRAGEAVVSPTAVPRVLLRRMDGRFTLVLWHEVQAGPGSTDPRPIDLTIAGVQGDVAACTIGPGRCEMRAVERLASGRYRLPVADSPVLVDFRTGPAR